MNVLGIETSCDETAASVVVEKSDSQHQSIVLSNIISSQADIHREWGGVVPEIASRQHVRNICGVVEKALLDSGIAWHELTAIAVTQGPGLVGSLLVGVAFAKALAVSLRVPLVAVNHLAGHIESLFLDDASLLCPSIVLVVSGGHTSLFEVPAPGEYHLIGRTRDDAAGEAYDKVAKLLGLGYPGGPAIDRLALDGNDRAIDFPIARMTHIDRNADALQSVYPDGFSKLIQGRTDFSFSGLKTAVARYVRSQSYRKSMSEDAKELGLSRNEIADICASFQRAVIEALLDRTFEAARWFGAKSIGIAGGVSANSRLRTETIERGLRKNLPVLVPGLELSTDNAAMIAAAGLRLLRAGKTTNLSLNAEATLPI